jgi:hypothetical protein
MEASRYWIFDQEDSPMGLPLGRLIQRLREQYPAAEGCEITRSQGYGEQVVTWDGQLDGSESVVAELVLLQRICTDREEWFYNFDAALPGYDVRFGLHDSTALFIEGERASVEPLTRGFVDVRSAPDWRPFLG